MTGAGLSKPNFASAEYTRSLERRKTGWVFPCPRNAAYVQEGLQGSGASRLEYHLLCAVAQIPYIQRSTALRRACRVIPWTGILEMVWNETNPARRNT